MRGGWIPDTVLPERLRGTRWTVAPRHLVVIALVLAAGLTWAGCSVLRSRPEPIPERSTQTPGLTTGTPVSAPTPTTKPPTPQTTLVIHVAGKVRRPGLIHTKSGNRVADALEAAGGALPGTDLSTLNLARPLTDGEQILVGTTNLPPAPSSTSRPTTPTATGPIDLNTATIDQLDDLPGVGPVLAQRILDYRTEHGRFTTIDQLQEVSGVGTKKYEDLKPHVRI